MGKSRDDKHQDFFDEMKRRAKELGRSVAELASWTPFELAQPISDLPYDSIYLNSRYQVNVRKVDCPPPFGQAVELSIKARDRAPVHDWRDIQRIKNEIVGPHVEAVELFPAEGRLVDTSNQYYVFCFPHLQFFQRRFPFGFSDRFVSEISFRGSVQRPFSEGSKPEDLETQEEFLRRTREELQRQQESKEGK